MKYSYHYSKSDEVKFEKFISQLEEEFGGERSAWGIRGGAIDLVTAFEVIIGPLALVTAKTIVGKYLDGLLNTDAIKAVGTRHRQKILALSQSGAAEIRSLCQKINLMMGSGLADAFHGDELAITLILPIENLACYIVLNQEGVDAQSLDVIPDAINLLLELKISGAIPNDAHTSQLFFDVESNSWRYLFIPSSEGFGQHIDRFIDLKNGVILPVKNRLEFIDRFHPSTNDRLKFLVSPFRDEIMTINKSIILDHNLI
jgi:hypothetical protein